MDKERRKKAVQKSQAAGDDFKPSDLGPTCLIVCPASVMENWARELETVSRDACFGKSRALTSPCLCCSVGLL